MSVEEYRELDKLKHQITPGVESAFKSPLYYCQALIGDLKTFLAINYCVVVYSITREIPLPIKEIAAKFQLP